jgi:hypothetical protein
MRTLILASALALAFGSAAHAQSFSSLEERMTAKEFREAGLDKLSDEELRALNAWVQRNVRLAEQGGAAAPAAAAGSAAPTSAQATSDTRGFENAERTEISSRILGPFKGWSGKTVFTLENGMVWQQVEDDRAAFTAESPAVTISPGTFGSWRLKVEGSNRTTLVKRIK